MKEGESIFEPINSSDSGSLQVCLAEVGARLGDVFGADNVLWVEGETEELCFRKILERLARRPLMGTEIVAISQTSLKKRDAKRILEIYHRLSGGNSLLPAAIGFILDCDCRTAMEMEDLKRQSEGRMTFLPRRMFENYLLNPAAIAEVLNRLDEGRDTQVSTENVTTLIEEKRSRQDYFRPLQVNNTETWTENIDAAKLLQDVFAELSESRVNYGNRKVEHGLALTEWLIEHSRHELQELSDFLVGVLERTEPNWQN